MLGDQRLELGDELRMPTELKLGVDPLELGRQPKLAQTGDVVALRPLENDVGEGRAAPERERPPPELE